MQRMIADQVGASIAGVIASLPLQVDSIVTHISYQVQMHTTDDLHS
jgi:hypothetical protein